MALRLKAVRGPVDRHEGNEIVRCQYADERINPGDSTASTPTGTFTPEDLDRPGSGIDQVDGLRPGIRPGTPPDSPTFNQNPAGSEVPNTSADKNTGGTTEDTRNP